jgi:hypothetical protein
MAQTSRATGWWVFAGTLLGLAGVLNLIWGIAAVGNSKFFTENATLILSDLHGWGWVTIVIGLIQLIAAFSLFSGGGFGRFIGIFAASLSAIAALMASSSAPFWGIAVFFLAIVTIYELAKDPNKAAI